MTSFSRISIKKNWETLRKVLYIRIKLARIIPVRTRFPRPPPPWPEVNKVKVPPISGRIWGANLMGGAPSPGWVTRLVHEENGENPPRAPKTKMTIWEHPPKKWRWCIFPNRKWGDFPMSILVFYWVYFLGRSFVWSHQSIKESSSIWSWGFKTKKQLLYTVLTTFP